MSERECKICSVDISDRHANAQYCSRICREQKIPVVEDLERPTSQQELIQSLLDTLWPKRHDYHVANTIVRLLPLVSDSTSGTPMNVFDGEPFNMTSEQHEEFKNTVLEVIERRDAD